MEKEQCSYCGKSDELKNLELDHIFPKSLGGEDHISNLTLACRKCNTRKRNKTIEVFLLEIGIHEFKKTSEKSLKKLVKERFSPGLHYKQFMSARLEPELIDWLKTEKMNYKSWNLFFRELRKRYETNKI